MCEKVSQFRDLFVFKYEKSVLLRLESLSSCYKIIVFPQVRLYFLLNVSPAEGVKVEVFMSRPACECLCVCVLAHMCVYLEVSLVSPVTLTVHASKLSLLQFNEYSVA